jgi:hypothetical protein
MPALNSLAKKTNRVTQTSNKGAGIPATFRFGEE